MIYFDKSNGKSTGGEGDWECRSITNLQFKIGWVFPDDPVAKNQPCNAEDTGSIPGREDSTCHGATKLVCRNYQVCTLEPENHDRSQHALELVPRNRRSHCSEEPAHHGYRKPSLNNRDPAQTKIHNKCFWKIKCNKIGCTGQMSLRK